MIKPRLTQDRLETTDIAKRRVRFNLAQSAAALSLLLGAAGCATTQSESSADAATSARVRSALSSAGIRPDYPFRIETKNGVVELFGFVSDGAQQHLAGEITASTAGVHAVANHILVMPDRGSAGGGNMHSN